MKKRPRRLRHRRPPLTVAQVLAWADHEFRATGRWPGCKDAEVLADPTEKWSTIDAALRMGHPNARAEAVDDFSEFDPGGANRDGSRTRSST